MTPWLIAAIAGLAGCLWALIERAKRVRAEAEARINFAAAKEANARADSEHAYAENQLARANRLELASHTAAEACRAELPKLIADIADPVDRARVAGDRLRAIFDEAARTTAADALMPWPGDPGVPAGGGG